MSDLSKRIADLSPEKRALLEMRLKGRTVDISREEAVSRVQPVARDGALSLSFAQERLWFLDQLEPGNTAYNIPTAYRLRGPLDMTALEQSLNEIVRRHEALHTTFAMVEGQPVQVIAPNLRLTLPVVDLQNLPEAEQKARRLATDEAQRPFDLAQAPLLRATLLRLGDEEYVLLLTMHHIVSDGWSMGVFNRELSALYGAFSVGHPSPLPELPIQYADFAHWQRQWLQGEVLETQLAYWKQQLGGSLPVLELPTDRPRPAVQAFQGASEFFVLPAALSWRLKTLSRREGTTLFTTLLAAFKVLLHRYTGQADIVVGSPIANRNRSEIEGLIGFFVNTLVLRTDLSGNPTFHELLGRVREVTLEAHAHQDLPFEKLVEELQPERDPSRNPLFQVLFALQNTPTETLALPGLTVSPLEIDAKTAQFDLAFSIEETEQGLKGVIEYSTDLFNASTITRLVRHFRTLLEGIVADPERRLSKLPLLVEAERLQLLVEWNDTKADYPQDRCIHQLFEDQVTRTPQAVAVIFEEEQLSYAELNRRANQLAHYLRKLGVGPEVLVGICLERSVEMVVGLLGILKAGGAYVPLDPTHPKGRLAFMLEDTQAPVLLTQQRLLEGLAGQGASVVRLDADWEAIAKECNENPVSDVIAENLAYVIYTSGSTGKPKGVAISHEAAVNLIDWVNKTFGIDPSDRILFVTSLCFDLSVYDVFGLLAAGGSIQVPTESEVRDPERLLRMLCHKPITFWDSAPAALQQLVPLFSLIKPDWRTDRLRLVFLSGDWIPVTLPDVMRAAFPQAEVISLGGATEATIWSNYYPIGKVDPDWVSIPYGKPIQNAQYYILDSHLSPCPVGVPGDLYIRGECLALGYANRPELTAEKFIPDPLSGKSGARLYRTGDRARYWADGNIEFLGRIDSQVKIRGFRIELGEIETVLGRHPSVQEAVAMAREDVPDDKRLVAYIVPKDRERTPMTRELRDFLKEKLPEYMVPSVFVTLDALPLTPNGKVDRRALPAPDTSRPETEEEFVAPRTPVEEVLAGIWAEALGLERVGVHDNFFDLGGHSLLAMQVVAKANQAGIAATIQQLMQHPTVSELAKVAASEIIHAEQGLVTGKAPCLPQQIHILQILPDYDYKYFIAYTMVESDQRLDPSILQKAVQYLVMHHDALRTRLVYDGAGWHQLFAEAEENPVFSWFDLSELSDTEQDSAVRTIALSLNEKMNISEGPLIQVVAFDLGIQRPQRLLAIVSHFAADGVSLEIFMEDLETAYLQLSRGEAIKLPPKTTSVKYYAERLSQFAGTTELKRMLDYWLSIDLTKVHRLPEASGESAEAAVLSTSISKEETLALLRQVPTADGPQIMDVLLTALVQSFKRWTGEPTLLLRVLNHGRDPLFEDVDLWRTVGVMRVLDVLFLNLEQAESPQDALADVQRQLRQAPPPGVFFPGRFLCDDAEVADKLRQCYEKTQVHLNLWIPYHTSSGPSLFAPVHASILRGASYSPHPTLHLIGDMNPNGQLELGWSYYRRYYHHTTIENLAGEYIKALRSLIASVVSKVS